MSKKLIKGNVIKNVIIIILTVLFWPLLSHSLSQIKPEQINDFLIIISMLIMTVCFANFAFTYEKSKLEVPGIKLLSHSATLIYMLLLALLLECLVLATKIIYPSFYGIFFGFSLLLYIGLVAYDFWDYMRYA